jgi:hypothetical protein
MSGLVQNIAHVGITQASCAEMTAGLDSYNSHFTLAFP